MTKFLLIFIFLADGTPKLKSYRFAEHQECMNSAFALAESTVEAGKTLISAECYSVPPSWGLE